MNFIKKYAVLFICICSALVFLPFLGSVHLFDWDEINFAECAREMLVSGNYLNLQMNFKPFWEKPPLFIWLQVLSMKCFGVNEFAARFPNAICGMLTLVVLFVCGKRLYDRRMGFLWALCYAGSTLPHFYFKSGIIDPWFNLFIFLSMLFFLLHSNPSRAQRNFLMISLSAAMAGLALLTKGPAALVILGLAIFVVYALKRFRGFLSVKELLLYLLMVLLFGGVWFIILVARGKTAIIESFISYQVHLFRVEDSGHGGPFYYHLLVLFFGFFPASVLALPSLKNTEGESLQGYFHKGMLVLFLVVLILFSIVQTKIIHYSSLCYFPLTFFAARTAWRLWNGEAALKLWHRILLPVSALLIIVILSILPLLDKLKARIISSGLVNDAFALENLQAQVEWGGGEWLLGLGMALLVCVAIILLVRKNFKAALLLLLIGNLVITELALVFLVPRIERYTQGAVIDFYKGLQDKDCYAESLNYLSYAQYFYTNKQPENATINRDWMLSEAIEKDAYFVSKSTLHEQNTRDFKKIYEIGRKNGWVFYKRHRTDTGFDKPRR